MTWIAQKTRGTRVTIAGVDYTEALVDVALTDASAMGAGIVTCSGTIKLAQTSGGLDVRDLTRTLFTRGSQVLIDVRDGAGNWTRHPRGFLFVISSTFEPESNTLEVEVGCGLVMRSLSDNVDGLLGFTSLYLAEADQDFASLSSALFSEAKVLWQDGTGTNRLADVFDGDGGGSQKAPAEWVSVGGVTAIEASPLSVGTIPPDRIELTYRWRNVISPGGGTGETEETESDYFLEHPANWLAEVAVNGSPTVQTVKRNYAVHAVATSSKVYEGPGGQLSYEYQDRIGPAVELAGQYYADLFESCRGVVDWFEVKGDPNHGCEPGGLQGVTQSYSTRTYEYGSGGEVLRTVESQYRNRLSCAVPANWRPGAVYVNGEVVTLPWRSIPEDEYFLNQRVITAYEYFDDRTVQTTETWRSPCNCNNAGLDAGSIDATEGSKTTERRTSRSRLANPAQPDRAPSVDVAKTETGSISDERGAGGYLTNVPGAGPIRLQVQVPTALEGPVAAAEVTASRFLTYYRDLLEGDAGGLRVIEPLRAEVLAGYVPGMPFSYVDPQSGTVIKLRMNATSWALNRDEAMVSTDGLFIGISNGSLVVPSNVVGSGSPLPPSGTTTAPSGPPSPVAPSITGETAITNGRALTMVVRIGTTVGWSWDDRLFNPAGTVTINQGIRQGLSIRGMITGPGGLLSTSSDGGLPLTGGGSLMTSSTTIIDADVFA